MKVLFVHPHYREKFYQYAHIPIGLGYLAQYLKCRGISYGMMDMGLDLGKAYSRLDLKNRINEFKPDFVCISMLTYRYKDTYDLISFIRNCGNSFKIVAGGPHISTVDEDALRKCDAIDYGIVLEGEETLFELCSGKPPEDIKGLIYRENGRIKANETRPFIENLDDLEFPQYDNFRLDKYPQERMILSSRGCPYSCTYCPNKTTIGRKLRIRSPKNVVDEIEYWYKKGAREFNFADDNFTFYSERVYEICSEIKRRSLNDMKLSCANGIRADKVDRNLLKEMKEAGFYLFSFGVEAGNNRILKLLKKGATIERMEEAIRVSCEMGFQVRLYFLVGSPGETKDDVEDSIRLGLKYPVITARFYNIIPFPKTELYDYLNEHNYFLKPPEIYLNETTVYDNEPVFQTPGLPYAERKRLLKRTKKIMHKVLVNYNMRLLKKYGFLGRIAAYINMSSLVQKFLMRKPWFRAIKNVMKGILLKKETAEKPQCILCKESDVKPIHTVPVKYRTADVYRNHTFTLYKCNKCDLIFAEPKLSYSGYSRLYDEDYLKNLNKDMPYRKKGYRKILLKAMEKRGERGMLLDIGCGDGYFLDMAKKDGWRVCGTEPSQVLCAYAKGNYELPVKCSFTEGDLFSAGTMDMVSLLDVIGHDVDPPKTLSAVKNWIKEDGLLVVRIPNFKSLYQGFRFIESKLFKIDKLHLPHVIYRFDLKNIEILLNKSGFAIEERMPSYESYNVLRIPKGKGFKNRIYGFYKVGAKAVLTNVSRLFKQPNAYVLFCKKERSSV